MNPAIFGGYRGKTVDFARYSDRHRTSLVHFLNKGKWDSSALETSLRQSVVEKFYQHQYIRYNPSDLATKPSRVRYVANEPYGIEEIAQLISVTKNEPVFWPASTACAAPRPWDFAGPASTLKPGGFTSALRLSRKRLATTLSVRFVMIPPRQNQAAALCPCAPIRITTSNFSVAAS